MVVVAGVFGFPRKQVGPESFSAGHLDITSTFLAAFKPQFPGKTNNIQPAKHWSFKQSEAIDRNCLALLQGIHHTIANALRQPDTLKRRQCQILGMPSWASGIPFVIFPPATGPVPNLLRCVTINVLLFLLYSPGNLFHKWNQHENIFFLQMSRFFIFKLIAFFRQ